MRAMRVSIGPENLIRHLLGSEPPLTRETFIKPYLKRASSRLTVEIVLFYGVSGSLAAMQNAHVLATVRREARMRRGQRGSRDGAEQFQSVTLRGRRLGQLLEFHAARFQSHAVAAERCQVLDEILEALYRPT